MVPRKVSLRMRMCYPSRSADALACSVSAVLVALLGTPCREPVSIWQVYLGGMHAEAGRAYGAHAHIGKADISSPEGGLRTLHLRSAG